ncbi:MAG: hypothetical protein Q8P05_05845 [Candidatus Diapherotrites archaeon]|nr:hypothetical protein [Candidatus Diapherotrites archaeon]MDZ4256596.1 hypothetical protein [archaeon]
MYSRGQTGLDLVLSLIIVLVALLAFTGVVDGFQKSQLEISIRQQARENLDAVAELTIYTHQHFHSNIPYGLGGGINLPQKTNQYTKFTGTIPTLPVKGLSQAGGYDCLFDFQFFDNPNATDQQDGLSIVIPSTQTGLADDVYVDRNLIAPEQFQRWAKLDFTNCGYDFSIR